MKLTIRYNRTNRLDNNREALVHLDVYFSANCRKFLSTGIKVAPNQWDDKYKCVKNHPNEKALNGYLERLVARIKDEYYTKSRENFNPTQFLQDCELLLHPEKENRDTFNHFCHTELEREKALLAKSTYTNQANILRTLDGFKHSINMSEVKTVLRDFHYHLVDEGLGNNTIDKYHRTLKKMINRAITSGLLKYEDNPYNTFKIKKDPINRQDLSFDQLATIENLQYQSHPHLQLALDVFLFSCYTGLRFSDVDNLRTDALRNDSNGWSIALDKMIKVRKSIYLPISQLFEGKAVGIINKYFPLAQVQQYNQNNQDAKIFPRIVNQVINRNLKIIAHDAAVPFNLTFHIARHTFGTNIADLSNGNSFLIMDLMGHGNIRTSTVYIHQSKERVLKAVSGIDWTKAQMNN